MLIMMEPLISVIIPVYNVEAHLNQCLDSVLSSTYTNLQIILVDDGSTDSCNLICDDYADRDHRITVIHKENQGAADARNSGLAVANGEFIAFVDSDDVVSPPLFETLLWAIQYTNSDISACEYTRTDKFTTFPRTPPSPECLKIINGFDGCIRVFSGEPSARAITWTGPMVWNKLYRREKITTVFRKECVPAEDMQFNWEYAKNCSKMVIVPQALYFWRITANSITQSPNVYKYAAIARVWSEIAQNTHSVNTALQSHLFYRAASSAHESMRQIIDANLESEYPEIMDQAISVIKQYYRELVTHTDVTFYMRCVYMLCRYCFPLWKLLLKTYRFLKKVCK